MNKNEAGEYVVKDAFVYCDGIVIDNVAIFYIDHADNEIVFFDEKYNEVGIIYDIDSRERCTISEYVDKDFIDTKIIKNGEIVLKDIMED